MKKLEIIYILAEARRKKSTVRAKHERNEGKTQIRKRWSNVRHGYHTWNARHGNRAWHLLSTEIVNTKEITHYRKATDSLHEASRVYEKHVMIIGHRTFQTLKLWTQKWSLTTEKTRENMHEASRVYETHVMVIGRGTCQTRKLNIFPCKYYCFCFL